MKRKNNVFNVYDKFWKNDCLKSLNNKLFNNENEFYDDYDSISMSLTKQKSQINSMKFMYKNKKPFFSNSSNKIKKKINYFSFNNNNKDFYKENKKFNNFMEKNFNEKNLNNEIKKIDLNSQKKNENQMKNLLYFFNNNNNNNNKYFISDLNNLKGKFNNKNFISKEKKKSLNPLTKKEEIKQKEKEEFNLFLNFDIKNIKNKNKNNNNKLNLLTL